MNLVLQERPMHDQLLHLDCFQSFDHGKHDLERIDHGFLCSPCISFQVVGEMIFFVFWKFPMSVAMRSSLLNHIVRN